MNRQLKGILFDFDGTLARTMEDHFFAWQSVMRDFGVDLKAEDYYPLEGTKVKELPARFFDLYGINAKEKYAHQFGSFEKLSEVLLKRKEEHYVKHNQFSFYPGVEDLISKLRTRKIPIGIVTTGLLDRIQKSVPSEFLEQFNVVITGDMSVRGKPHPDPYLKGAEVLKLDPSKCLVVENSPLGIQSGKSAGAYCVGVCSTVAASFLKQADEVIDEIQNLPKLESFRSIYERV